MTGTLGNLHAVYVLDLRPSQGWTGFGTHMSAARFPALGTIGPPLLAEVHATRVRRLRGRHFVEYRYRLEQEGRLLYEASQTAMWFQGPVDGGAAPPNPAG